MPFGYTIPVVVTTLVASSALVVSILNANFWRKAKVSFESLGSLQINEATRLEGVQLKVFLNEEAIEGNVFSMFGRFTNTGGRDLIRDDFIKPLVVSVPQDCKVVAVYTNEISASDIEFDISKNAVGVLWSLLKPSEEVSLTMLVATEGSRPGGRLTCAPRLKDVGVGSRMSTSLPVRIVTQLLAGGVLVAGLVFLTNRCSGGEMFKYRENAEWLNKACSQPDLNAREKELCRRSTLIINQLSAAGD